MAKFLVIAEKPSVAQSLAKNLSAYQREEAIWRGTVALSVGAWDIWQNMHHQKFMMKNMKNGSLRIYRSSRKYGKCRYQRIKRSSLKYCAA